ncbi:Hsp70 family protein [Nocardia sp. SYP-A9097]|uniref:Hsp70 family protein n=1 Tax=Nocardia sp. SYP-A9097 TaxID=2663237 RepID=UPI00129AC6F4|nr:Hsp70 family protein [Nocardia sp. SYP-A9097]MRH91677.1 Hsp70 family protein [Nocardia sp. SYP-A9097]
MIAIGIDLGTTFSVVARFDGTEAPRVIAAPDGRAITPSVVYFDNQHIVVGADAVRLGLDEPDRVVRGIKRQMGTRFALAFDGNEYTPETVSALILKALVDNAAATLGCAPGDFAAVVTVPAYFGVTEREATAQAVRLAGLELLDLVAEPVAAAACYGATRAAAGAVLVFDLGGGTFDTTVLRMSAGGPEVVVTDGDSHLGGLDWNDRLCDILLRKFEGSVDPEIAATADDDTAFLEHVGAAADKAKIALTARDSVPVTLEYDGGRSVVHLTRKEFEEASAHLVSNCVTVADRALAAARARGADRLERILLVGGATRMPTIRAALEGHFGVEVTMFEPDLAVAKGAAMHAHSLVSKTRPSLPGGATGRRMLAAPVRTVLPRALGILIHDSRDRSGDSRIVNHVVEANTALPVKGARARFATILDGQDKIRVEVYEQAGAIASPDLRHNRRVLDGELVDVPHLPAGSPIDIEFDIGADGRISCTATEPKSGRLLLLESYMEGVIDAEDSERQQTLLAGLRIHL